MSDNCWENVRCNLCNSDDYESISEIGQFGLPAHVVICRACGLTYLNPRWTKQRYAKFYQDEYDNYYRPNIQTESNITGQAIDRRLSDLNPNFNPKNILDIGAGAGINLDYFKHKYPLANLFAIEPSEVAAAILENKSVELISKDIDAEWAINHQGKFDFIIMRHVLEHLSNPVDALKRVRSSLSENGILYIAVPNNMKPTKHLQRFWFRVVHTYYFNDRTLKGVLIKSELNPLHIQQGDDFSPNEIFSFIEKNSTGQEAVIDKGNHERQREVFRKHAQSERSLARMLSRLRVFLLSRMPFRQS